jgi:hypothetical protein
MIVWIYVDNRKMAGDKDHLRVFASADAARAWFVQPSPRAWRLNKRTKY